MLYLIVLCYFFQTVWILNKMLSRIWSDDKSALVFTGRVMCICGIRITLASTLLLLSLLLLLLLLLLLFLLLYRFYFIYIP